MITAIEQYLVSLLGDPSTVGAKSWLEALPWLAALFIAYVAGISLRRQSLQSRAALLLSLYERWDTIADERMLFADFFKPVQEKIQKEHSDVKEVHQIKHLKDAFFEALPKKLEDEKFYFSFLKYASFIETLGVYVKNGYVSMRDVRQLYKGAILDFEIATRTYIDAWQEKLHVAPGLLENALYLMRRMRLRETSKIYYFTFYQIERLFRY